MSANNEDTLFQQAIGLGSPQERAAFLAGACHGDAALRARLDALVEAHQRAGSFLENPAAGMAVQTLEAGGDAPWPTVPPQPGGIGEGPGSTVGRYKLLQQIGEGGMGVVYMAAQEKPVRRRVALKIIKPGMDSAQVIVRFEAERQALAMMDHPNIARVLDAGTTDTGRPYFVMELVQGIPITQYCDDKLLSTTERLELFIHVCNAIQHAHQKGIIHRDLKPSNVLIAIYDAKPVPKIIDFGVAKALHQRLTEKTMFTQFGAVVGTLEYMSPEQADMDLMGTDTRSDIYSLGVLLYELLTGSTPMDGKRLRSLGYAEMLKTIREVDPPKPSTRLSQSANEVASISAKRQTEPRRLQKMVAGDLDWIVMKCLEKDRARRYETANGLSMDIQRHLQDEAVTASPPRQLYKFQKLVRNKLACTAVASVILALLIGLAASLWQAQRAEREAERAQRESERATSEAKLTRLAESQAKATLDELRATAPAFVVEARALAAKGEFDRAIEKLNYAAKLQPGAPEHLVAKGDLYLCQLKFPQAAAAYRDALRLKPGLAPVELKANLSDQLLAAPTSTQGKLSLESMVKIWPALEPEKRSDAELATVRKAYFGEKQRLRDYWLPRLQALPMYANVPFTSKEYRFFEIRKDGQLILYGNVGLRFSDFSQFKDLPIAELYLADNRYVTDVQALADIPSLENVTVPVLARNIDALRKLPKLKRLSFSSKNYDPSGERSHYFSKQGPGPFGDELMHRMSLVDIDGVLERPMPDTTAEEFWKEYSTLSWLSRLRDSATQPNEISRQPDGTWTLKFDNQKEFTDLTFLHGMPISFLSLGTTPVADLSPLRGMPLKGLGIWWTKVTDLTLIKDVPLTFLDMSGTIINDISPLNGMPIDYLSLDDTRITDLSPLRGMPLTTLRLRGCANLTDLSPLADTRQLTQLVLPPNFTDFAFLHTLPKLQRLSFTEDSQYLPDKSADEFWAAIASLEPWGRKLTADGITFTSSKLPDASYEVAVHSAQFTDCSIFAGSNVRRLDLDRTSVTDLRPLADLPLTSLSVRETKLADLSPLRSSVLGKSLRELRIWQTGVTDVSPVAGCTRLELFDAYGRPLEDLAIIKGMKLKTLLIGGTNVTDLSVVAGMPLETVNLDRTAVKDLSPLLKCPTLQALVLPTNPENIESLHGLPNLARLSYTGISGGDPDKSVEEFWAEYDRKAESAVKSATTNPARD